MGRKNAMVVDCHQVEASARGESSLTRVTTHAKNVVE